MKRCISFFLALLTAASLCPPAVMAEDAPSVGAPGVNFFTGDTGVLDFSNAEASAWWTGADVKTYPANDTVTKTIVTDDTQGEYLRVTWGESFNKNGMVYGEFYPAGKNSGVAIEDDRPVYFGFKSRTQTVAGAKSSNYFKIGNKTSAGIYDGGDIEYSYTDHCTWVTGTSWTYYHTSFKKAKDSDKINRYRISFGPSSTSGGIAQIIDVDDIVAAPYYKFTYYVDGAEYEHAYVSPINGSTGEFLTEISPSQVDEPQKDGESFAGWSLTQGGKVVNKVSLNNADVKLYAVWSSEEDAAYTPYHFDLSNEGMLQNDSDAKTTYDSASNTLTFTMGAKSGGYGNGHTYTVPEGLSVSDYPYLVFKSKLDDVHDIGGLHVYYSDYNSNPSYAENLTIDTTGLVVGDDIYFIVNWKNKLGADYATCCYKSFMYSGSSVGSVVFHDIYLTHSLGTILGSEAYNFDLANRSMVRKYGAVEMTYDESTKLLNFSRSKAEDGGAYTSALPPVFTVKSHPYLFYRAKTSDINGFGKLFVYYSDEAHAYSSQRGAYADTFTDGEYTYFCVDWKKVLGKDFYNSYYKQFMYKSSETGSVKFDKIFLSPTAAIFDKIYNYDLSAAEMCETSGSGLSAEYNPSEKTLGINASGTGGDVLTSKLPQGVCTAEKLPYFVFKAKKSDTNIEALKVNYSDTVSAVTKSLSVGNYIYYYINWADILEQDLLSEGYGRFSYAPTAAGKASFEEIVLAASLDDVTNSISEITLVSEADEITTAGGTVVLSPTAKYTNGDTANITDADISADSLCAALTLNDDGTVTVTGKYNGTVTVKASVRSAGITAEKKIKISGQEDLIAAKKLKWVSYGNYLAEKDGDADYVPYLKAMLEKKYGEISHIYGRGAETFEADIDTASANEKWGVKLDGVEAFVKSEQPDIVTLQIGEFTAADDAYAYRNALSSFVDAVRRGAPNTVVMLTLPAGSDMQSSLSAGAKALAEEKNLPIANLSSVLPTLKTPESNELGKIAEEMYNSLAPYLTGAVDSKIKYLPNAEKISISGGSEITENGGTLTLKCDVTPSASAQEVVWISSDETVATVSENGVVTAHKNGTASISASSVYNKSVSGIVKITVSGQSPSYTVTFAKNTDDTVTNMPQAISAKGCISMPDVIPVRKGYRFCGWSLRTDGNVRDELDVDADTTLYAVWERAVVWTFEKDGYSEGFRTENGFGEKAFGGALRIADFGKQKTVIISPELSVKSDEYRSLDIVAQNTSVSDSAAVTVKFKTTDGNVELTKNIASTAKTKYSFPLSDINGTITGFEIQFSNGKSNIITDDIRFEKNTAYFLLDASQEHISEPYKIYVNGEERELKDKSLYEVELENGSGIVTVTGSEGSVTYTVTNAADRLGFCYEGNGHKFYARPTEKNACAVSAAYDTQGRLLTVSVGTEINDGEAWYLIDTAGAARTALLKIDSLSSLKPYTEAREIIPSDSGVVHGVSPKNGEAVDTASDILKDWLAHYSYGSLMDFDRNRRSNETGVTLSWTACGNPESFVVSYGTSPELSDSKTVTVTACRAHISELYVAAKYYWRVTANFADGRSITSDTYSFYTKQSPRMLTLGGVDNERDIGGYVTEDGKYRIRQAMAYRSARLDTITADGKATALKDWKLKTELDLREENEIGTENILSINFINIPGVHYLSGPKHYLKKENEAILAREIKVFANPDNYPILFHCSAGRDRTGTLAMLLEGLLGVSREDILIDYELSWFTAYTEDYFDEFSELVDYIASYGGETFKEQTENYCLSIGVTAEEIASIRNILLEEINK